MESAAARVRSFLRILGPGVAVAATGVGAGDLIGATAAGSKYGVILLWTAVAGAVLLAGTGGERIVQEVKRIYNEPGVHDKMAGAENPYGDGKASERIADAILRHFRQ